MASDYSPDVRTWLLSISGVSTPVGTRVHHNYVPEAKDSPYVWFRLGNVTNDGRSLNSVAGEEDSVLSFDIEICGNSLSQAIGIAEAIRDTVPFRGSVGSKTAQMVDVENHDEDYIPKNEFSDDVRHIQTLSLKLYL